MSTYLKYRQAWMQLLVFGTLTVGIFMTLHFLIAQIFAIKFGISPADFLKTAYNDPAFIPVLKIYQAVLVIALFIIPSLVFGYLSDKKPLRYLGFRTPVPASFLLVAMVIIITAFPMVGWLSEMNHNMHLPKFMGSMEELIRESETKNNNLIKSFLIMKSPADLVVSLLLLALLPAVAEELFFRGVLQRLFIQISQRPWTGIIITAILFSALHGQFLGFIPRVVLGIVLGALYWYSGSLWPGMLAHFVNNAVQIVVVYYHPGYMDQDPIFLVGLIAGSTIIVIALTLYMRKISQTTYAEVYDTDDDFQIGSRDQYKA